MKTYIIQPTIPPGESLFKLSPLLQSSIVKALSDGMQLAATISQTRYLSGPRPSVLGVVTGLLRSSVKSAVTLGGGPGIFATGFLRAGMAGSEIKYAAVHEYGGRTSPHLIQAKNVKYLSFFWKKMGVWFVGPRVNHPGSVFPARPYLRPAMDDAFPTIDRLIQAAVDKAFSEGS